MSLPLRKGVLAAAMATVMASSALGGAWADVPVADGDGVTPVADNNMAVGAVDCGVAKTKSALIAVRRQAARTPATSSAAGPPSRSRSSRSAARGRARTSTRPPP